jgi:hypothetical protein
MAALQMIFGLGLVGAMMFFAPDTYSTSSLIFFSVMGLIIFANGARTFKGKSNE